VRVKHPSGHAVAHPVTYSTVLGSHPHGTAIVVVARHVGTGHRIAGQSAGLVVRVTLGHGVDVLVDLGGSVTTLVITRVGVDDVVVVRRMVDVDLRVVVVDGGVVGQGRGAVRNSMSHPW
jgi:hypothetical protein